MSNTVKGNANMFDVLFQKGNATPDKICIEESDGKTISYKQLIEASAQYANLLTDFGVNVGDRVAVQLDKSTEKLLLYLAVLRTGAIFLPLNTGYKINELQFFIEDAEPSLIVCRKALKKDLEPIGNGINAKVHTLESDGSGTLPALRIAQSHDFTTVPRQTSDLAAILYTSGTTGRSKGAMLSHGNLASNIKALYKVWQFSAEDVLIHALPIYHTHGLFVAFNLSVFAGASILFLEKFDVAKIIERLPRATVLMGVPTYYTRLLSSPAFTKEKTSTMRVFISGSAPMTVEVHKAFEERTGKIVLERYGMTETCMNTSNPFDGERRQGTVGLPLPGTKVRCADLETNDILTHSETGVLQVKGPNVFNGYWRLPEKTKEEFCDDGYFITGDLGTISEDGYVTIVGRSKDMIISGGLNIYPKEIEKRLNKIEGVKESAVFGVPHADWGETVVAAIVGTDNPPNETDIIATLKEDLASFKMPKRIVFIDELPRNAMSKIQKQVLRNEYGGLFL